MEKWMNSTQNGITMCKEWKSQYYQKKLWIINCTWLLKASKCNPVITKCRKSITFHFPLFYCCVKLKPLCYTSFFEARFWIILNNSVSTFNSNRVLLIRSAGSIPSTASKLFDVFLIVHHSTVIPRLTSDPANEFFG